MRRSCAKNIAKNITLFTSLPPSNNFQLKENQWKSHWKTHFCDPLKHKEQQKNKTKENEIFPTHLVGNLDARDRKLRSCVRGRRRLYFSPAPHIAFILQAIQNKLLSPGWLYKNIEMITLWTVFSLWPNISVTLN